MTSTNEPRGFEMVELRRRSEQEIEHLVSDCLAQATITPPPYGTDNPWRKDNRVRMRGLIQDLGLMKPVPNPCVGRLHRQNRPDLVINVACDVLGIAKDTLLGPRHSSDIAQARQLLFYVMKEQCQQMSLPDIGKTLGKDHTTVMHGVKRARARLKTDPSYADSYQRILARLAYEQ